MPLLSNSVYFDGGGVSAAARTMRDQIAGLRRVKAGIESVRTDMACTISTQMFADKALCRIGEDLERIAVRLDDLSARTDGIIDCYRSAENDAASLIAAQPSHV